MTAAAQLQTEPAANTDDRPGTTFFSGDYKAAAASVEGLTFAPPVEVLRSLRNVETLWDASATECAVLRALLPRANGDWLVKAAEGWLSDVTRINKNELRATLRALSNKGYIRRIKGARKEPTIIGLRRLDDRPTRPERWVWPAKPKRVRGEKDDARRIETTDVLVQTSNAHEERTTLRLLRARQHPVTLPPAIPLEDDEPF